MFNRNWNIHMTSKDRYEFTGVLDLAINHLQHKGIKAPIIIDVGCSSGVAIERAAYKMKTLKFNPYTIGIDPVKTQRKKAEKNLDVFINKDVFEVYDKYESADIVICSKAAIFVEGHIREAIIRKCVSFLKENGILITDVDCFPPRSLREQMFRISRPLWYLVPTLECFKYGIKNIEREYAKRANTTIREDVFKKTKQDAISYADEIISGWNKRSPNWKRWWKFKILLLAGLYYM